MSFDGDLQHLPIVDVIQLLHATGKSGTLTLRSLKGESQLVFHEGYIVSANHVNNSVRIGQVLLDMGVISYEELESALHEQQKAGSQRKPVIQTLIEAGKLNADEAYQGLEVLIEMTIVEILTWNKGTFSLDVNISTVSDEYRYFPEQLEKEIQMNTQSVLMDALRIYDEKKRDGTLEQGSVFGPAPDLLSATSPDTLISVEDLGLDELDQIERKIPRLFTPLGEAEPETTAKKLQILLTGVPAEEQQRLLRFIEGLEAGAAAGDNSAVILFSEDKLLRECVAAVCGPRFLCCTSDPTGVDAIIDQSHSQGRSLRLLIDAGEPNSRKGGSNELLVLLQQKRERFPDLVIALLTCPGDFELNAGALKSGASAVVPRSSRLDRRETFIADTIECCQALQSYLSNLRPESGPGVGDLSQFKEQFASISEKREPSEVTYALLQAVATVFDRVVTLVSVRSELVAEKGIGISAAGETSSLKLRVPVGGHSLFQKALEGESYYGDADVEVRESMKGAIGAPASPKILLLPVRSFGRVIALIYGDFGSRAGGVPQMELLEILAQHAGLIIDNALYRKRCAQKPA